MHSKLKTMTLLVGCTLAWSMGPTGTVNGAEENLKKALTVQYRNPSKKTTTDVRAAEKKLKDAQHDIFATYAAAILAPSAIAGREVRWAMQDIRDPSIAYRLEFNNFADESELFYLDASFEIDPLSANTVSGFLNLELIDANNDGNVSLTGNFGGIGAIQAVQVIDAEANTAEFVGPPLGTAFTTPGLHSIVLDPLAGPTPSGNELLLRLNFYLSAGDTVHIASQYIIDEGTGVPIAQVPDLPDPADGPYFNVIDVDSPETSLDDNWFIGSQTQLNLSEGGSIGERFNLDAFMNHQLSDYNFDTEVNITGGTAWATSSWPSAARR